MINQRALFFEPWVGTRYAAWPEGITEAPVYPMHILGESHYGNLEEYEPSFTRSVVENRALQPSLGPFFTNLTKLVTFSAPTVDRATVWNTLAFSNYIQDMLPGPGIAPDDAMWQRGHAAFEELLTRYRPDMLLVLGQRLWRSMSKAGSYRLHPKCDGEVAVNDARLYERTEDGQRYWTLAMHVLHPSARGGAFRLDIAQRRLQLFHEYGNGIDTRGIFEANDETRRDRLTVTDC